RLRVSCDLAVARSRCRSSPPQPLQRRRGRDEMASRPDQAELNAMARRVIDANHYMTLATQDADGRPRLSPLYYTCARYSDFYWVSSPTAHHSRNLGSRP